MIDEIEFRKGLLFIRLKGNLDKYKVNLLKNKINKFINKYGIRFFVLNINKLINITPVAKLILEKQIINNKILICDNKTNVNCFKINNEIDAFKLIKI